MKRVKRGFGRILYSIAKRMPESNSKLNLGQKKLREFCGKLILNKCGDNVNIEKGAQFASAVELGNNSGIGIRATLTGRVIIGSQVMMGPECIIYTKNHLFSRTDIPMCQQGFDEEQPVIIEDDVWIGGRVIILPGVRIGHGSVIGAGAVVTSDIEPFSIVGGVPARLIRKRK